MPWARTSASLCWSKASRPKSCQQAMRSDSSIPKSLTPFPYTKLDQNSVTAMPGKVTTYEEVYHCGTAQAQPHSISRINITEEGTVAAVCLLKGATWTKVWFSCLQHAHLQRAAPSSEVLHWWMPCELLCLCSVLQEQPIGLMSKQGWNSTPNICTETPDDISAETMVKGPVI